MKTFFKYINNSTDLFLPKKVVAFYIQEIPSFTSGKCNLKKKETDKRNTLKHLYFPKNKQLKSINKTQCFILLTNNNLSTARHARMIKVKNTKFRHGSLYKEYRLRTDIKSII